jgi:hypothetical protein
VKLKRKELKKKLKIKINSYIAQEERDVNLKQDIQKIENKALTEKNRIEV